MKIKTTVRRRSTSALQSYEQKYSEVQRQWACTSIATVNDELFGCEMVIGNRARQPITHFHAWLQKRQREDNDRQAEHVTMELLVANKAKDISDQFESLLSTATWNDGYTWRVLCEASPAVKQSCLALAVLCVLELFAD